MTARVKARECTMGFALSTDDWKPRFLVINDGRIRIYLSDHDAENHPDKFLFDAPLDNTFEASNWKRADYHLSASHTIDLYCFYLKQAGMMGMTAMFKIGVEDMEETDKLLRCIQANKTVRG